MRLSERFAVAWFEHGSSSYGYGSRAAGLFLVLGHSGARTMCIAHV
jgi:hypothetical protein